MNLNYNGLRETGAWRQAQIEVPAYDPKAVAEETLARPVWVHFGAGNIFRGYIAALQDKLLNEGAAQSGIIAVETFDTEVIRRIYKPYDNLTLLVTLRADGNSDKRVIASVAGGVIAEDSFVILQDIFCAKTLQMVSFTITEKGYALYDMAGTLLPVVWKDVVGGPKHPTHVIAVLTSLLYTRYQNGGAPIALVSMDNCSHNGQKLKEAVLGIADLWQKGGHVDEGFVAYLSDGARVSFPWSMIDKITPRPAPEISEELTRLGAINMQPIVTTKGTHIAPFVNAEVSEYLVIEDDFPAGRPPLERAGVYFTDRDTVNGVERMKVCTCLNPLHTALAVFGCLLGYTKISDEMGDAQLYKLVRRIGYVEGMPVVTDPGIIDPGVFLDEVVNERLPNPFIPDTPQRIACDTSQKMPIRFGETIKAYMASPELSTKNLVGISLVLAGWLRYLLGVDDTLNQMPVSSDPLLEQMRAALEGIKTDDPQSVGNKLESILKNATLFGADLYEAGLAQTVTTMFLSMLQGEGAVRSTLKKYLD